MEKYKDDVWSLIAFSASASISVLVNPLLFAVLLFSDHPLSVFGFYMCPAQLLWMKFGERQTHAGETDEWPGRGDEGGNEAVIGGEGKREMVGDWKGRSNPPWREKEGNSKGLKGREREECWDSEE